jgi:hypothetical protein
LQLGDSFWENFGKIAQIQGKMQTLKKKIQIFEIENLKEKKVIPNE